MVLGAVLSKFAPLGSHVYSQWRVQERLLGQVLSPTFAFVPVGSKVRTRVARRVILLSSSYKGGERWSSKHGVLGSLFWRFHLISLRWVR